jgi:hypothetical protein
MKKIKYTDSQPHVHLDGRRLAYELRGKTAAQRAVIAAQYLADGHKIVLYSPTEKQVASLFRVSVATLDAAKALGPAELAAVYWYCAPLVSPTRKLERDIVTVGTDQAFSTLERVMDSNGASAG